MYLIKTFPDVSRENAATGAAHRREKTTFIRPEEDYLQTSMTTIGLILCRIGLHRWGRKRGYDEYSSNVIEWEQRCERCGKRKRWVEVKRDRRR